MSLTPHAEKNRAYWTSMSGQWVEAGRRCWQSETPNWGVFNIPEAEANFFGDPEGYRSKDVIELGCGTGYVSAWLARMGAKPVGIDVTPAQLESARRFQEEFGIQFPLIEASAERSPFPDQSFDFAVTEYGACIWCDPALWLLEAARVLPPGGRLTFLRNSTLSMLCNDNVGPSQERLLCTYPDVARFEDHEAVEFHPPHGELIRLLKNAGFVVEELIELLAPEGKETRFDYVTAEWACRWPFEEIWKVRKQDSIICRQAF